MKLTMNKILYSALLCAVALSSCSNEEDLLFSESAAERLNATSDIYTRRLEAQPNGWAMQLYPTYKDEAPYGSGFLVLMDFDADHSVKVAMNNSVTLNTYKEDRSGWDIITDNGPVLTFNTHNSVLHQFSDPEDLPSTGDKDNEIDETGEGMGGDFEFVIVDAPEDASYMMLKGKKRGTYNLLTPIEEGIDYEEYLNDVNAFQARMFSKTSPSFAVMHYGDSLYRFEDAGEGLPAIYPFDGDKVIDSKFNPFIITKRGQDYYLRFRDVHVTPSGKKAQDYKYLTDRDIFQSVEDPTYYLDGDTPSRFFLETLATNGTAWICKPDAPMSPAMEALINDIKEAFKPLKYTFQSFDLRYNNDKLVLRLNYKAGKTNSKPDYTMTAEASTEGVNLTFVGGDAKAQGVLDKLPALKRLTEAVTGNFTITAGETKFNLSTLRLTSVANPDLWFVMSK